MTLHFTLTLVLFLGPNIVKSESQDSVAYRVFHKPGEFMIGGLFPMHTEVSDLENHWKPEPMTCKCLNPTGLLQALAMKFTLEEINNSSTLLPGQTLGYEIFNTCLSPLAILHPVLLFLARNGTQDVEVTCNLTEYKTRVLAVIGPSTTEISSATMKLFSTFLIPQISYSITSEMFSDRSIYPAFHRTVPSDKKQVDGMVTLISHFKWNWIAAVASEDDYGQTALQQFSSSAMSKEICIAYEGIIPIYLSNSQTSFAIEDILDRIQQTDVNVVLVFASLPQAIALFNKVIERNMTKLWIGSASWVLSERILSIQGIKRIGPVIGFFPRAQAVPGFNNFLNDAVSEINSQQSPLQSISKNAINDVIDCETDDISAMVNPLTELHAKSVYTAAYAVAYSLHNLLNCDSVKCDKKESNIYPWKLLEEVKKVNFTIFNTTFNFDQQGNPNSGFDIVTHSTDETEDLYTYRKIGSYNNILILNTSLINWGTEGNQVPMSQCSSNCAPGQIKRVKGTHSCCFDCIDCQEGMYQSSGDDFQCLPCPAGQWSNPRSTDCSYPTFLYMQWTDISVICLLLITAVLICAILGTFGLFLKHRNTPIIQASGGNMSLFSLLSQLAVAFSMVLFIGHPISVVCQMQQPLLAIGFTCCLSTFTVKALQVMLVTDFKGVPPKYMQFLKTKGTWATVGFSILIQCLFCSLHIHSTINISQNEEVTFLYKYLKCEIPNILVFSLMFGYNGILALISFMLNCVAQAPPGQYNLARDITFSMLTYLLLWIIFVPVYAEVSDGSQSVLQMVVTLVSSFGIMLGYFAPKCYILLLKPEMASEEYFKIYIN
ncbi:taste receptor type 1 member 3-like [Discoglossus pictus]